MDATAAPDDGTAPAHPADMLYDALLARFWEQALRRGLQFEHGSEGCTRRACRQAGSCRMKWIEGKRIECGAGVSETAIVTAASLVDFGAMMVICHLGDVALAERDAARKLGRDAGEPAKPKARRAGKPR